MSWPLRYAPGKKDLGKNPQSKANLKVFEEYIRFGNEVRMDWIHEAYAKDASEEARLPMHFDLHSKSLQFYSEYEDFMSLSPSSSLFPSASSWHSEFIVRTCR